MRKSKIIVSTLMVLYSLSVLLNAAGGRINVTHSFPVGLYWVVSKTPEKGDLVLFCPPDETVFQMAKNRGYISVGQCEHKYQRLIKKILAAKNDKVRIGKEGVFVNDNWVERSKPLVEDALHRPMPDISLEKELGTDEILLMSDQSEKSFDARYFGVMNSHSIVDVIKPIFTWI